MGGGRPPCRPLGGRPPPCTTSPASGLFASLEKTSLKKIKISKIYVRFENFQKYTSVALWGRHALNVIFFFKFATRSLAGGARVEGGPVTPLGRPGAHTQSLLYKHSTLIPFSFEPKNSTENPEKMIGVRRSEAVEPCRIAHL